jgi:hypothetical protein
MSSKNKRRLSIGKGALLPMSAYADENDSGAANEEFLEELANDDQTEKKARCVAAACLICSPNRTARRLTIHNWRLTTISCGRRKSFANQRRKSLGGAMSPFKAKTDQKKMVNINDMITNVIKMSSENVRTVPLLHSP